MAELEPAQALPPPVGAGKQRCQTPLSWLSSRPASEATPGATSAAGAAGGSSAADGEIGSPALKPRRERSILGGAKQALQDGVRALTPRRLRNGAAELSAELGSPPKAAAQRRGSLSPAKQRGRPSSPTGDGADGATSAAGIGAAAIAFGSSNEVHASPGGVRAESDMARLAEQQEQEQAREQEEEEEESEEAQTMWQAAFTFLPVLSSLVWTVVVEAIEAGTCQLLAVVALPVWASLKALFGVLEEPDPCDLDPLCNNPPPPPSDPNIQVVVTTWMEEFAE